MLPYYYGEPAEALRLAAEARAIVASFPCPAAAMSAAAEARAEARLGYHSHATAAMTAAQRIFDIADDPGPDDAFCFPHKRLLLYLSGTTAHLDQSRQTERMQSAALDAYATSPDSFVIDPALIRLDQAATLARSNKVDDACQLAIDAIDALPPDHRTNILTRRGQDVLRAVPAAERKRNAAEDLRGLLAAATT